MYENNLYIAVALLCKLIIIVTITRHTFINIFKMERFSAVKFAITIIIIIIIIMIIMIIIIIIIIII